MLTLSLTSRRVSLPISNDKRSSGIVSERGTIYARRTLPLGCRHASIHKSSGCRKVGWWRQCVVLQRLSQFENETCYFR